MLLQIRFIFIVILYLFVHNVFLSIMFKIDNTNLLFFKIIYNHPL